MWEGELKIPKTLHSTGGVDRTRVPKDLVFVILMAIFGRQNRYHISKTCDIYLYTTVQIALIHPSLQ